MRKSVVTLACLFFISACKPSDNYVIPLGENLVKDKLIDPDSAKFNSFFHKSGDLYGYVCGDVNSKNTFGGYTGKKPYFVYLEVVDGKVKSHGTVTIVNDHDPSSMEKYKLFCQ